MTAMASTASLPAMVLVSRFAGMARMVALAGAGIVTTVDSTATRRR